LALTPPVLLPPEGDIIPVNGVAEPIPTITTRLGQQIRQPQRYLEAYAAEMSNPGPLMVAYEVVQDIHDDSFAENNMHPLTAYAASADPDTMYLHQAMQQPDREQFLKAMQREIADQSNNGNWKIIHRSAMRRKRRISTQEVYKWKARLNIDGSKQQKGINYWETFAPVASWPTIRMMLILATIKGWKTKQIDFVQAYTQAKAETTNLYMQVPKGFEVQGANTKDYVLQIVQNIYGQKQAGRVWNKHLMAKLTSIGFTTSKYDPCVLFRTHCIYVLYTDDSILIGPTDKDLEKVVTDMQASGLQLTCEGTINDFLGVHVERKDDGSMHLTQPHLITQILQDLQLDRPHVATKETPAKVGQLLKRCNHSSAFDGHFNYRSVIGKLNYLEQSTRRFLAAPMKEHGQAVTWIGRYLLATRDKGLILRPTNASFDCYVDADFSRNWDKDNATNDSDTARSRSGYIMVVLYSGNPSFKQ
jgi:hypothetical protein